MRASRAKVVLVVPQVRVRSGCHSQPEEQVPEAARTLEFSHRCKPRNLEKKPRVSQDSGAPSRRNGDVREQTADCGEAAPHLSVTHHLHTRVVLPLLRCPLPPPSSTPSSPSWVLGSPAAIGSVLDINYSSLANTHMVWPFLPLTANSSNQRTNQAITYRRIHYLPT